MHRLLSRGLVSARGVGRIRPRNFCRIHCEQPSSNLTRLSPQNSHIGYTLRSRALSTIPKNQDGLSTSHDSISTPIEEGTISTIKESQIAEGELHEFRYNLNRWYRTYHDVSLKNSFFAEDLDIVSEDGAILKKLWTAKFICPFSGDEVLSTQLDGCDCENIDGRWYYSKKKLSLQAAAKEALERYNLEGEVSEERNALVAYYMKEHSMALTQDMFSARSKKSVGNSPIAVWWTASFTCPVTKQIFKAGELKGNEGMHSDSAGWWYGEKEDAIHAVETKVLDSKNELNASLAEESNASCASTKEAPKIDTDYLHSSMKRDPLVSWYRENYEIELSNDNFVVSSLSLKGEYGGNWWTSSFICPISGERYDSGTLRQRREMYIDSDGVIWYRKKEDSIVASALRAFDSFMNTESGTKEPRYCEEFPAINSNGPAKQKNGNVVEQNNEITRSEEEFRGDNIDEVEIPSDSEFVIESDVVTVVPASNLAIGENDTIDETDAADDTDDDEFVVETIPRRMGTSQATTTKTTIDLIAETWIESAEIPTSTTTIRENPLLERQVAIDRAFSWIAQHQVPNDRLYGSHVQFDVREQSNNRKIANLILDSIASAHQRLPFNGKRCGVEDAAHAILEYMWSTPSTSPDADTYAAFIKCLEGEQPAKIAERAQKIYDAMSSQTHFEGRLLPLPNVNVYNSLLQRLAEAGKKVLPFDNLDILPDRESLLVGLSACAFAEEEKDDVGDDHFVFARKCIDHMKKIAFDNNDPSFIPDIQVYNAPMKWSAGQFSALSRPYSRCVAWDDYSKLFRNGFTEFNEQNALIKQAMATEDWLEMMKNELDGADGPNIETYECIMQAWIRTGTIEGLQKAEEYLLSLLGEPDKSLFPRMITFHPVISAWAYSGAANSIEKVDHWISLLEENVPEARVDPRMLSAKIAARLASQNRIIRDFKQTSQNMEKHQTSSDLDICVKQSQEFADSISNMVDEIIEAKTGNDMFIQCDLFLMKIEGYRKILELPTLGNVDDHLDSVVTAIKETLESFDMLVARLFTSRDQLSAKQLHHLVESAPKVYSAAISAIIECDKLQRGSSLPMAQEESFLAKNLDVFEEKLRRSEEYRLLAEDIIAEGETSGQNIAANMTKNDLSFQDRFKYPCQQLIDLKAEDTWPMFYEILVQAVREGCTGTIRIQDTIRVCLLVSEVLKAQNMSKAKADSKILKQVVSLLEMPVIKHAGQDALVSGVVRNLEAVIVKQQQVFKSDTRDSTRGARKPAKTKSKEQGKNRIRRRRNRGFENQKGTNSRRPSYRANRHRKQSV